MLKNLFVSILFFLTLYTSVEVAAQSPLTAGNRLFFTQTAHNIQTGLFHVSLTGSGFTKSGDYLNPVKGTTEDLSIFISDLTFDYGLNKHFSLTVGTTIAQSLFPNEGSGTDTDYLNEVRLIGKFGSIELISKHLNFCILTAIHLPIQAEKNTPFFLLRSGSLDIETMLLASYYFDPVLKESTTSIHFNIGPEFLLTSDGDFSRVSNQTAVVSTSKLAFNYAFGINHPISNFDLFLELSGRFYTGDDLPDFVYSRENHAYLGGGVKWQMLDWLQFSLMGHFLMTGGDSDDETVFNPTIGVYQLSESDINYTPYYVSAGFQFEFGKNYDLYNTDKFESEPTQISDEEKDRYNQIEDIIGANSQELVDIYYKGLQTDKKLQGTVYFDITINPDGTTKNARILVSTFHETNIARMVENQMLDEVKTWHYPTGENELHIEILKMNFSTKSCRFITN